MARGEKGAPRPAPRGCMGNYRSLRRSRYFFFFFAGFFAAFFGLLLAFAIYLPPPFSWLVGV